MSSILGLARVDYLLRIAKFSHLSKVRWCFITLVIASARLHDNSKFNKLGLGPFGALISDSSVAGMPL